MAAEYLSRKYIEDNNIHSLSVSSAGTLVHSDHPFPRTLERLSFYGCDASQHQQRQINQEILWEQDLIICMAEHHRKSVNELWFDAVLFNEIAYEKSEDVLDDIEYMNQYWPAFELDDYIKIIVDYIHDAIPLVIKNIRLN